MSRFLNPAWAELEPYVPGEQPKGMDRLIKLNTNESPFGPTPSVAEAVAAVVSGLNRYSDPGMSELRAELAALHGLPPECVMVGNGSDEILALAFQAFAPGAVAFPDVTYGFYSVLAGLGHLEAKVVALREDYSIAVEDYESIAAAGIPIVIANPNAPTGLALGLAEIERLAAFNSDCLVIIDEAYVDFGGESAVALTQRYPNLLVTQTFSKSRSLAGGRLGMAFANPEIIADLDRLRCAQNPYDVNAMTAAAGLATLRDDALVQERCAQVASLRGAVTETLRELGAQVLESRANFIFVRHPLVPGEQMYRELRQREILVRHFGAERTKDFVRVTIGSESDMAAFVSAYAEIVKTSEL